MKPSLLSISLFIALALVAVGLVVLGLRTKPVPPSSAVGEPDVSASNSAPAVVVQATAEPAGSLVEARAGQRDGRGQMADGKGARPIPAQYGERGSMGPLQLMRGLLDLSDEQAKKLEPVFKEQQDKINALRRETGLSRQERVVRIREMQTGMDTKIKAQLRPEQAEKWQKARANPGQMFQQQGQSVMRSNALWDARQGQNGRQPRPSSQRPAEQP